MTITPTMLYNDIKAFLERGILSTHDFSTVCLPGPAAPGWTHDHSHTITNCPLFSTTKQFLPPCTMGKGERSIHFLLFQHLQTYTLHTHPNPSYYIIPEFSDISLSTIPPKRHSVDLLIIEAATGMPIAAIELKHYSVHQSGGVSTLLNSMVEDYTKYITHFPSISLNAIKISVPLIQIGLLTAIYQAPIPTTHSISFIKKYVIAGKKGALCNTGSTTSNNRYNKAMSIAARWCGTHSVPYSQGHGGWGPVECYTLPGVPDPIVGRVGYVCVMTP